MGFTVPEAQDDQSGKWEAPTGRVHDTPAAAPITGKKHEMTSEMYLIDMLKLSKGGSTFILHGRGDQLAKTFP